MRRFWPLPLRIGGDNRRSCSGTDPFAYPVDSLRFRGLFEAILFDLLIIALAIAVVGKRVALVWGSSRSYWGVLSD